MSKIVLGSFLGVGLLRAGVNLYVSIDGKWMRLCEKRMGNCKYLDLIKSTGPWGACLFSIDGNFSRCAERMFHDPIDNIPATGGLMVMSSLMALLSLAIVATVILSTYLGYWADGFKKNLAVGIAGVLMLLSGLFELIVTVWITTAAYRSGEMMANRPPLYFAWVGVFLSFLPGAIVTSDYLWKECCPCQVEPEEEEEEEEEEWYFVSDLPMMPILKPNRVVKPCPEMMVVDVYTGMPVMVKPKVDSSPERVESNLVWNYGNRNYISD
ncbi:claudin-11-like [Festucalex cinctus]